MRLGERVAYRYNDHDSQFGVVLGLVTGITSTGIHVAVLRPASAYATAFWQNSKRALYSPDDLKDLKVNEWCSLEPEKK